MQPETTHSTRRFFGHSAEMVAVMFIGMFALSMPADLALRRVRREHIEPAPGDDGSFDGHHDDRADGGLDALARARLAADQ